jgi:hypothetical protein
MNDDVTLKDIQRIREMFMEVFVVVGYNPALCSVDEYFNAKLAKSVCAAQFAGLKGWKDADVLGIILVSPDNNAQNVSDITRTLDALRQGKSHTIDNPLLQSVKKVTGDYPSVFSTLEKIIFMNPQQWERFLEAEKKFASQYKSPEEILAYLEKCLNSKDTRGA